MRHLSVVPSLRVPAIAAELTLWEALGYRLAFAYQGDELLGEGELGLATFARLDAESDHPVSVFLTTDQGRPGGLVHLMLEQPVDVDTAARKLEEARIELDQPPTDQRWGTRELRVRDGGGNALVVGAAIARG